MLQFLCGIPNVLTDMITSYIDWVVDEWRITISEPDLEYDAAGSGYYKQHTFTVVASPNRDGFVTARDVSFPSLEYPEHSRIQFERRQRLLQSNGSCTHSTWNVIYEGKLQEGAFAINQYEVKTSLYTFVFNAVNLCRYQLQSIDIPHDATFYEGKASK